MFKGSIKVKAIDVCVYLESCGTGYENKYRGQFSWNMTFVTGHAGFL